MAEDPDAVDELRWAWYVDKLAMSATNDLEHTAEELTDSERMRSAKDERMREILIAEITGRQRMRILDAMETRRQVRVALLLSEVPDRG